MCEHKYKEFEEISNNVRHWERMRWVSMTVFMAIMAVSFNAYFSSGTQIGQFNSYLLRITGIAMVAVFWVQDERIVAYWKSTRERAKEVEKELGIKVFSITPHRGLFSSGTAVRILYSIFLILWVFQFFL
ncbi:MAG: hypothetical protein KKA54_13470 [Proteobacteria bacterium]|nr:hypothetical protein [Pseudomonadota bacterium]MBU0967377.1 hypothetical protein [Pseudomonadota bacterium]